MDEPLITEVLKIVAFVVALAVGVALIIPLVGHLFIAWDNWLGRVLG